MKNRIELNQMTVRRVCDRAEVARKHHYLGFRSLFGGGVRQVAQLPDGTWVALPGWQASSR